MVDWMTCSFAKVWCDNLGSSVLFFCPKFGAGMYGVPSEVSTEHQQDKTTIRFESNEMLLLLLLLLYMTFVL